MKLNKDCKPLKSIFQPIFVDEIDWLVLPVCPALQGDTDWSCGQKKHPHLVMEVSDDDPGEPKSSNKS